MQAGITLSLAKRLDSSICALIQTLIEATLVHPTSVKNNCEHFFPLMDTVLANQVEFFEFHYGTFCTDIIKEVLQ